MSVVAPKLFKSSDSGASTLTGQVGKLVQIMDECLVLNRMFTAISGASFVDNSAEARLEGGSTFKLFQGPTATNDEAYFGLQQPFEQIVFDLGTFGAGGATLVWEYWNGSAWTSFVPTDGTNGFTHDGRVSWSIAALTGWATTAVNSVTVYWVRVRFTGSFSTNPLVNSLTITGWAVAFSATNIRIYRMGAGSAGLMVRIQDDGNNYGTAVAATAGAAEAQWAGCESASDISTTVNEFPTAAQLTTRLAVRKSATADATTRGWAILADDRTYYLLMGAPGGAVVNGLTYSLTYFGEFYSFQPGDPWKVIALGRDVNNQLGSTERGLVQVAANAAMTGCYLARGYTGAPGSLPAGTHADGVLSNATAAMQIGILPFPNGPDGGLWLAEVFVNDNTGGVGNVRGRLRGLMAFTHTSTTGIADQSTVQGAGGLAGKTFRFFVNTIIHLAAFETSDTWPVSS